MFVKKNSVGETVLVIFVHVDITLIVGRAEDIAWLKSEVKRWFNIKEIGQLDKHLGIRYSWETDDSGARYVVATMHELIDEIITITETHLKAPV